MKLGLPGLRTTAPRQLRKLSHQQSRSLLEREARPPGVAKYSATIAVPAVDTPGAKARPSDIAKYSDVAAATTVAELVGEAWPQKCEKYSVTTAAKVVGVSEAQLPEISKCRATVVFEWTAF